MKKIIIILAALIFVVGAVFIIQNVRKMNRGDRVMNKKILVTYFSATGNTKTVAQNLANVLNCDIYEIKPLKPYSGDDLDWTDENSRSSVEMKNHKSRPEIVKDDLNIKDYDVVFVGFPIWWYIAPTIINTFLEQHDFSNKEIILFATSGGSGFGKTVDNLKPSVSNSTKIKQGKVFSPNTIPQELKSWAIDIID